MGYSTLQLNERPLNFGFHVKIDAYRTGLCAHDIIANNIYF